MQKRDTRKKGFTLVEVIVVLVVLVITAGATYSATKSLVSRAEQDARDQVARALFMASQSALTQIYANDPALASRYAGMTQINLSRIDPWPENSEEWQKELAVNGGDKQNIVTISSGGGTGAQAQMLMDLIGSYVDDTAVLKNNILIEYNRETGNVLACFYSDVTTLSHGEGGYDVYSRGESALKLGRVGYYGVSYTGSRAVRLPDSEPEDSNEMEVLLADYDGSDTKQGNDINGGSNYGLLTLECSLPEDAPANMVYELTIHCKNPVTGATQSSWTLTVGNHNTADIRLDAVRGRDLEDALERPLSYDRNRRQAALFMDAQRDASGREVMVLVLDSAAASWSIRDLYPEIAGGVLVATMSMPTDNPLWGQVNVNYLTAITPYSEHALYAGFEEQHEGGVSHFTLSSVRHLNNVRYGADQDFRQTSDIPVVDYEGSTLPLTPIPAFSGSYNGGDKRIVGLTVPANTQHAGLFARINGGARVEHVFLENAEIAGTGTAGGIAADNDGTIYACTVYHEPDAAQNHGCFITAGGGGTAGGIAAVNTGEIKACYVGTGVRAGDIAGGVAGESSGTVWYSEVCTAMERTVAGMPGALVGATYFGATASSAQYKYGDQSFEGSFREIGVNQRWIEVTGVSSIDGGTMRATGAVAGGVVGLQTGGSVQCCVNAAHIGAAKGVAGGVVGSVYDEDHAAESDYSLLLNSYNAGWVQGSVLTGGVAGQLFGGKVQYCYNTAPINTTLSEYNSIRRCYLPAEAAQTSPVAGGIIGRVHMFSRVEYCYNASYVCAGDLTAYAGAFGRVANDSSVNVKACYFLRSSLNASERFYLFESNGETHPAVHMDNDNQSRQKCVTVLDIRTMKKLIDEASNPFRRLVNSNLCVHTYNDHATPQPAGPYFRLNNPDTQQPSKQYEFPVLNVADGSCSMGMNFHRTPYYPILESFGELSLEREANDFVLTALVPANQAVTLRLWMSIGDVYYRYIANIPAGGPGSSLTFQCGQAAAAGFSGDIDATATESNVDGRRQYVVHIPITASDPDSPFSRSPEDFHGQLLAPSTVEKLLGNLVWAETKVRE